MADLTAEVPNATTDAELLSLQERIDELEAVNGRLLRRIASLGEEQARSSERARLYAADARAHQANAKAHEANARVHEANARTQAAEARRQAADAATLRIQLADAQAHVQAIVASTSWRLTQPIRTIVDPLRRIVRGRPPRQAFIPPLPGPAPQPRWLQPTAPPQPELQPLAEAVAGPETPRRRAWPPLGFPLPDELAAHPALLAEPPPPLTERVSVIIPTWNAGHELPWLIRKLQAQRGLGGLEIITVDSGSTDGTPDIAASLGCRVVPIDQASFSHSVARNLGASKATGDLLLFMVQDAYPVGDDWLLGLARCLLHPGREEDRVSALSCAEYCRTDSELIYDFMARTHYEFLGCGTADRVGRLTTLDHEGLRRQGQLSDVACLIPRDLFEKFEFEGRYAEDLTLGIRLIEAGYQLGMLSSIRVVHAHNRSAGYYVRRCFVDLVFLAQSFPDFTLPAGHEPVGAVAAAASLARLVPRFAADLRTGVPAKMLERVIDAWREEAMPKTVSASDDGSFGFAPLQDWIARLHADRKLHGRTLSPTERRGAEALRDMVVARLVALHHYIAEAWPMADESAVAELGAAVMKTIAMSLGAHLACCHLTDAAHGQRDPLLAELKPLLLAGI